MKIHINRLPPDDGYYWAISRDYLDFPRVVQVDAGEAFGIGRSDPFHIGAGSGWLLYGPLNCDGALDAIIRDLAAGSNSTQRQAEKIIGTPPSYWLSTG